MWRVAERITAPTLVITGRQDKLVDVRVAPAVAKLIMDSRLLVLDKLAMWRRWSGPTWWRGPWRRCWTRCAEQALAVPSELAGAFR